MLLPIWKKNFGWLFCGDRGLSRDALAKSLILKIVYNF
jgi:hypothetical protein